MMDYIQLSQITKFYGPRKVLDNVSFKVQKGTIAAIVGENGAGKSTLMNILGGLTVKDHGELQLYGTAYSPQSAQDAFKNKIGFVHQHFLLAENLTALENLILSTSSQNSFLRKLPINEVKNRVNELTQQFNWTLKVDGLVRRLSVGDQQRIEILKSLLQNPDILILDEPTAVLSPFEIEKFLDFILQLKNLGKTIFLITHKLVEVKKVADQVVILRNGKVVQDSPLSETNTEEISEKIVGKNLTKSTFDRNLDEGKSIDIKIPNSNIQLRQKEIFGVAGVDGNGQVELIEKILSHVKKLHIPFADIAEDRLKKGIFPGLTLEDHVVLRHQKKFSRLGFILRKEARSTTEKLIQEWNVKPNDPKADISSLSGGNQQKFVVGKELWHNPDFILAAHPTRGLDLGAQEQIHENLFKRRNQNKTIFLVSADLDEVLKLSDRYVILYKNNVLGPFLRNQLSEKEIGAYMTGLNV